MSEFELSTLAVLALLLFAVGAYSYWQVHRAQKAQEARQAELAELAVEPPSQHRYPAYVPEQEPLPETWPSAPASVQSEPTNHPAIEFHAEMPEASVVQATPAVQTVSVTAKSENEQVEPSMAAGLGDEALGEGALEGGTFDSGTFEGNAETTEQNTAQPIVQDIAHDTAEEAVEKTVHEVRENAVATAEAPEVIDAEPSLTSHPTDMPSESERVQTALDKMVAHNPLEPSAEAVVPNAPMALARAPQDDNLSAVELAKSAVPDASPVTTATETETVRSDAAAPVSTPDEIMSAIIAEPAITGKTVPVTFDLDDEEEKERIAQRITAQEMKRRATWEVFAPFARFEHWLHTAHPQGVDPIRAIDAEIVITVNQPKTAEDIERALYDLRLDTPLPMRLYGARAGQISLESGAKRMWQDLQAGAPYCAIKLTLQLANRSHHAQEELIQRWFGLAEALRKRVAGHIDGLPDVYELSDYAQFLHALARRVGQPIILQLHKDNGLWPAYEVHQQLTACGAVLSERGIYVARSERNTPVYAVMNDVNNPRAQDFLRSQMAVMYVHTLSFCVELARIELRLDDSADADAKPLEPIQRLISDMKTVADALGAQWQNHVGEEISVDELEKIAHLQTRIFVRQLSELGLPVGALMTKRLLLG